MTDTTIIVVDNSSVILTSGTQGLRGVPGATGPQGPAGATGPQGPAGATDSGTVEFPEANNNTKLGFFLKKGFSGAVYWSGILDGGNALGVDQSIIPIGMFTFPSAAYDNSSVTFSF